MASDDPIRPRDAGDVTAAVQWALANSKTLEIVGQGSKRALGRPAQTDATLDLAGLTGVTLYEPEELVLSARAATSLAEIEQLVASHNQQLAFEPMDYGPLLGEAPGLGTLGGALATNLSGSRRLKAGAARDHFLGFTAISGRGETFKSGGRVVKNVTGYDLCKLLAGSWGTLAAMTDVTVKTLPRAETEATVLVAGLEDRKAVEIMGLALRSPCDISGAAHVPRPAAARLAAVPGVGRAVTVLRLEGVAPSVAHRTRVMQDLLRPSGPLHVLDEAQSRALWRSIRDMAAFAADGPAAGRCVWRISTAAANGAELGRRIAAQADVELAYDWAGGLVWAATAPSGDAGEASVRAAVAACGGHAMLVRAPAAIRALVPVFEPQTGPLAALTGRVKESFDPSRVLNPGRMWAGV
jgi:glycolate dehydrogenase FAD-binding subunit